MRPPNKSIILVITSLVTGVIIGGTALYYYIGGMCKDLVADFGYTSSSYDVSKNVRLLYKLRETRVESAINLIEQDLDVSVITLNSILDEDNELTKEQEEKIVKQLRAFKSYRDKYPKKYQLKEIESRITAIIKNIE